MVTPNPPPTLAATAPVSQVTRVERVNATLPQEPHVNPLLRLHLMLYGRYKWAITLGLVLGLCGAAVTWVLMPPKWEVVGYLRIKPYIPPIGAVGTDLTGLLPNFESFVNLQVSILQSQRVLDQASLNSDWVALKKDAISDARKLSPTALTVEHPKSSELVTVAYSDRDPNVAAVAVRAILEAYKATSGETDEVSNALRLQVLQEQRTSLGNQKRSKSDEILAIANEYGTDDLQGRYQFKMEEQNRLESELQQLALDISIAQAAQPSSTQPSTTPATAPSPVQLTRVGVAQFDPRMRDMLVEESRLMLRINQLRSRLGDNHREVLAAQSDWRLLEEQIDALLVESQAHELESPGTAAGAAMRTANDRLSLLELRARDTNIRTLFEKIQAETKALGQEDLKIRKLKSDQDAIQKNLDETDARIDHLNLDAKTANRIFVLSPGERPSAPLSSKRVPLTAAVGLLGLAAGVGFVALRGLVDRRVTCLQYMQQLVPAIRVLGMLPVLPDDFAEASQIALTAHCVHQIRNLLETAPIHDRGRVLAITSPSAGDGKTSLSLALGVSFAVSGSRTLLIDCDMVGGGLTSRLNAINHRRIGSVLRRKGLLTEHQIKEALGVAAESHKKLGETLVTLGYLKLEEVQLALKDQEETSVGLLDALRGEPLAHCVTSVVTEGLSILPLGHADSETTNQISAKALRRIIKEARSQFEFIIIDTGPILGSIEASVVAREADEVVLAVTRGSSSPLVTKTVELLASLNARLAGIVFNRATPGDVAYSKYGSSGSLRSFHSMASQPESQRSQNEPRSRAGSPPRLGPVAAAVAGIAPAPSGNGATKSSPNGQAGRQEPTAP